MYFLAKVILYRVAYPNVYYAQRGVGQKVRISLIFAFAAV